MEQISLLEGNMPVIAAVLLFYGALFVLLFYTMHRGHQATLCRLHLLSTQMRLMNWARGQSLHRDSPEHRVLMEMFRRTDLFHTFLLNAGVWSVTAIAYMRRNNTDTADPLLKKINALPDASMRQFLAEEYRRMYEGVYEYLAMTSLLLMPIMIVRRMQRKRLPDSGNISAVVCLTFARWITRDKSSDDASKARFARSFEESIGFAAEYAPKPYVTL